MKNGIRFCRPKLSKFPKVGDIVIKLKCGKTGVISEEEYKHVAKFFKMLSFLSDASDTSGNIKVTNKEYGGEITVSPEEYDKVKDKFDIVEIIGDRSKPNANGHDYVEIGGLKWATMNIGASQPSDYGLYFAWGDTQGYTAEQVGSGEGQKYFGWADYKYGNGTSSPGATGMTKYNATDGLTTLEAVDDAAVANWGGSWRMPTTAEFQALGAAVNTAWTQVNNVYGILCTDKTDSSKTLFFPAAGDCDGGSVEDVGDDGGYWSSSLYADDRQYAYDLYFLSDDAGWGDFSYRYFGYAVRPVVGGDSTQKGDVICHNDILNKDVIFSQEDWLRLDDTWTATGFVGINTYSEEDAEDGDFIIQSKGQTFIIKSEDYNDVRDGWEYVESFEYDYSKDYLTTEALESGTISFNIWKSMGTNYITSISYSTDDGETWTTTNNTNDKEENLQITVNVNEGDKILWKGDALQFGYYDEDEGDYIGSFFSSTARFNVFGNVMSMLYGDDFVDEEMLEYNSQFACLFYDYDEELECYVVDASNLSLVATTLTQHCYNSMFRSCTSLTTAPELPATTLTLGCYSYMFYRCTSLTAAPELPATTLAQDCYNSMFSGCTSLTTAPELPATTLAQDCYNSMFSGCTKLNNITCLATNIPVTNCTSNWVRDVAPSGTFTKAASMSNWTTGINGIPTNWTVQDAT